MNTRAYERLSIERFGAQLLDSGDLDPIYIALNGVEWPEEQKKRWLVAYWCLYHAGVSCWLSEREGMDFWQHLLVAAANEEPSPAGGRWPRSAERRHWRGAAATSCVYRLTARYEKPEDMVDWIIRQKVSIGEPGLLAGNPSALPYDLVAHRVTSHPSFGPWIAFKVADMIERCLGVPVFFGLNDIMYDSPRTAALRLAREREGLPLGATFKDEAAVVGRVVEHLLEVFRRNQAPPDYSRQVNLQEIETILCKWQSHMNGHYPLGKDTIEIAEGLEPWINVSPAAHEFHYFLPASRMIK